VNVPLTAGCGNGIVAALFEDLLLPLARAYRPQLILVSAGYDSQFRDPLGGLTLSEEAFQWMAFQLRELAREQDAGGPICFLEGGYDPEMTGRSIARTLHGLAGEKVTFSPEISPREQTALSRATQQIAPYWPGVFPTQ
jgi:acetoin utilization deacetylase AcuC-like enzyme